MEVDGETERAGCLGGNGGRVEVGLGEVRACGMGVVGAVAGQVGSESRREVKVGCLSGPVRKRKSHAGGEKSSMSDRCYV